MPYFVGRPSVFDQREFQSYVDDIFALGVLTNNGKYVQLLEAKVAEVSGAAHVVALSNATLALELLLSTLPRHSYVIAPSYTFIATTTAIFRAGLRPIFVDVTDHFKIDLNHLRQILADCRAKQLHVTAIMPVNLYGGMDIDPALFELATAHNLKVFYDSAHTLGTSCQVYGDAEVFSLHATKLVNGFEGGLVATNNAHLAIRLRQLRNFNYLTPHTGPIKNSEGEFVPFCPADEEQGIYSYGTNAKLSEIHAAMALSNLNHIGELIAHYKANHERYRMLINQRLGYEVVQEIGPFTNYSYVVCRHLKRDAILDHLKTHEIFARKYFYHLTHQQFGYQPQVPTSAQLVQEVFCLPTGLTIDADDVAFIAEQVVVALTE
ncbi:MAG: hypothetical protein FJ040_04970 [Chloroflexi bacterium]|nr:hypothetical protein [Chloroflexota bacterium]